MEISSSWKRVNSMLLFKKNIGDFSNVCCLEPTVLHKHYAQGLLLSVTWINFNPSMDKYIYFACPGIECVDKITYPSPNFNERWSLGMDKKCHPTHHNGDNYFYSLTLKVHPSPDLNLTPLAAFLRFLPSAASLAALGKNVKKQQEVSDLNQD